MVNVIKSISGTFGGFIERLGPLTPSPDLIEGSEKKELHVHKIEGDMLEVIHDTDIIMMAGFGKEDIGGSSVSTELESLDFLKSPGGLLTGYLEENSEGEKPKVIFVQTDHVGLNTVTLEKGPNRIVFGINKQLGIVASRLQRRTGNKWEDVDGGDDCGRLEELKLITGFSRELSESLLRGTGST